MPTSDELNALAEAVAAQGDRQAFAALFKHFGPRLKAWLVRSGSTPEVAEELVQDTFAAVWRKAAAFDAGRACVSTWVFTIARNLRTDRHRRGDACDGHETLDDDHDAPDDDAVPPEDHVGARQREAGVARALAQLSPEQAKILQLSYYEDHPHARIASELQIPLGTVKSRIRLAAARLRQLLEEFKP